jgi:hypothetical protein
MPVLIAFATGVYACSGSDLAKFSVACLYEGLTTARTAIGGLVGVYVIAAWQHSSGSASFNPNGTENAQVKEIVKADTEKQPVAVIPVPTAEIREQVRDAVSKGEVVQVLPPVKP